MGEYEADNESQEDFRKPFNKDSINPGKSLITEPQTKPLKTPATFEDDIEDSD